MTKFEVGTRYEMHWIGDSSMRSFYTVVKRTAKTVTIEDEEGKTKSCRINGYLLEKNGVEAIFPEGRFSMCPILYANEMAA